MPGAEKTPELKITTECLQGKGGRSSIRSQRDLPWTLTLWNTKGGRGQNYLSAFVLRGRPRDPDASAMFGRVDGYILAIGLRQVENKRIATVTGDDDKVGRPIVDGPLSVAIQSRSASQVSKRSASDLATGFNCSTRSPSQSQSLGSDTTTG